MSVDTKADSVEVEPKTEEKVTFTEQQQKEMDRLLGEQKSKWEQDLQKKLADAKTEAEKLTKMNGEQKAEYERKKRDDELMKRESEITRRELRATALETLAEKGLPKQLADILAYTDAESTNKSIAATEAAFREAVEAAVNERLKGNAPKNGGKDQSFEAKTIEAIFAQK